METRIGKDAGAIHREERGHSRFSTRMGVLVAGLALAAPLAGCEGRKPMIERALPAGFPSSASSPFNPFQPFDFSLVASPDSYAVVPGTMIATSITATLLSGPPQAVAVHYNCSAFWQCEMSVPSVVPSVLGTSFSLEVYALINSGPPISNPYPVTVTAEGGGITRVATFDLSLIPTSYTLSASPNSSSVFPGATAGTKVTATLISGPALSIPTNLDCGSLECYTSISSVDATVVPSVVGTAFSFTVATKLTTPPGIYRTYVSTYSPGIGIIPESAEYDVTVLPRNIIGP